MQTQFDHTVRAVSLANLSAMAERVSSTCHRFRVENVSANRVSVSYSNPDEYGCERPILAFFPAFPGYEKENPTVVLSAVRYSGGRSGELDEAWQTFTQLTDCPKLWRDPRDGAWKSDYEVAVEQFPQLAISSQWDKDGCVQTWFSDGASFTNWQAAQDHAVSLANGLRNSHRTQAS